MALVYFQVEGFALCLNHVCQRGYVDMNEINLGRPERKICCHCVDELQMGGNPEKLKKVRHITLYSTDESEEDKEEV